MPPFLGRERAAVGVDVDPVSDPVRRARVLFATTPTQAQSLSRSECKGRTTFLEGFAGLSGFAPPVALGMTRSRSPVGAAGAGPIATSTLVDNGATMSPLWQTAGWPLLLFALAVVAGGGAWGAAFAASSPVLGRVHEELLAVNETVYSNVQQFSLVPYTDNSDEYRDAVEGWYAHFKELCNLARQALHGPVEDAASRSLSFAMHSVPIAVAAGIVSSIWSFWQRRAGFLCAACLGYIAAAVVTMWSLVSLITSVNSGLAMILGDISGGTMQALLAQSNEDDEFLQLMLLTTGEGTMSCQSLSLVSADPPPSPVWWLILCLLSRCASRLLEADRRGSAVAVSPASSAPAQDTPPNTVLTPLGER